MTLRLAVAPCYTCGMPVEVWGANLGIVAVCGQCKMSAALTHPRTAVRLIHGYSRTTECPWCHEALSGALPEDIEYARDEHEKANPKCAAAFKRLLDDVVEP
jgi:hypothetical protein